MEYQIALSPELGLSPEDFVAAWNGKANCHVVAEACMTSPKSAQFDPTLLGVTLTVVGSLALGVASNALYDLIKELLMDCGVRKRTEIVQVDQPDGSRLLVVTITEE
jgi:hypothetical protein